MGDILLLDSTRKKSLLLASKQASFNFDIFFGLQEINSEVISKYTSLFSIYERGRVWDKNVPFLLSLLVKYKQLLVAAKVPHTCPSFAEDFILYRTEEPQFATPTTVFDMTTCYL